jgi:hypothetical protein
VRQPDHPSRGILPSGVCLHECDCEASIVRRPWPTGAVAPERTNSSGGGGGVEGDEVMTPNNRTVDTERQLISE